MVCEYEYMNIAPLPPPIIEFATPLLSLFIYLIYLVKIRFTCMLGEKMCCLAAIIEKHRKSEKDLNVVT